jgi:hypothetical protein
VAIFHELGAFESPEPSSLHRRTIGFYAGPLMRLPANELVALLVATSFAAGLNVYATVGTLGLLARFGVLPLPGFCVVVMGKGRAGSCVRERGLFYFLF